MNELTLQNLSILLNEKRNILSFIDNDLSITLLPPFRQGNNYFFKKSIYVQHIDQDNIKESDKLFKEWWKTFSLFKEDFRKLLCFHMMSSNYKIGNSKTLRQHLVNIEPSVDYMSRYDVEYNDGNHDYNILGTHELTEDRAKYEIILSKSKTLNIEFKNVKKTKKSKKELLII